MADLIQLTAVLAATNLNPSIFNPLWLVREGIIPEPEILSDSVFTPLAVNVHTNQFVLTVVPERLQLAFSPPYGPLINYHKVLQETVGQISAKLPHTPFYAIGFNIIWRLVYRNLTSYKAKERSIFLSEANPIGEYFKGDDSRFGSYLSKEWGDSRLRLDIKPIAHPNIKGKAMRMSFNFHKDLKSGQATDQIHRFLDTWNSAYKEAKTLAEKIGLE